MADVKGAESLLRKLNALPDMMRDEIKVVMAAQADETVALMKRLVPKQSGDLRDSIGWVWGNKAPSGSVSVGTAISGALEGLTITIYAGNSEAYYARWVEFGTKKMRARPFFFVSWRASRKPAKNKIRAAVRKVARQVAAAD